MPEMAKVWRDEARRAASDVARLVALREPATVARMDRVARRFLSLAGVLPAPEPPPGAAPALARVTHCIAARTAGFRFARPFRSGEVVPGGTLLAEEDGLPILAPHARTLIVMPNLLPQPGQTAVRLGRFS